MDNGLLLGNGFRQRLFAIDIFFAARGLGGDQCVPMIRHRDHDGVNVIARQQFPVIMITFAVLGLIMVVDHADRILQMIGVQITRRHHLAVVFNQK